MQTQSGKGLLSGRTVFRWCGLGLLSLGFFLGTLQADLVIFKDGFFIHGRIKQDKITFVDPASKRVFAAAKLDGFFMVDDGARRVIFAATQVADATRQNFEQAADLIKVGRIMRPGGGRGLPKDWWAVGTSELTKAWRRSVFIRYPGMPQKAPLRIPQYLTQLTPRHLRLDAGGYNWDSYYLTREFKPETIRMLLYEHLGRQKKPLKKPDQYYYVFRFLLQAGWYREAEKELNDLVKEFPKEKKTVGKAREVLKKLKALQLADWIERARKAGQHHRARYLLDRLEKDKITPDQLPEKRLIALQALVAKYRQAAKDIKRVRALLKALPRHIPETGHREVFEEAAKVISKELNEDTLPRLAGFLGMAAQAQRDRAKRKKPRHDTEQLLSLAVSGWLMGNDTAETNVVTAMQLWAARKFVLAYQKTDGSVARGNLRKAFAKQNRLELDELLQMIRLLPPPEPEKTLPKGVVKLKPLGQGTAKPYHVQLPPEYHPNRSYPVLVVLHGSDTDGKTMLGRFKELAAQYGYILAAPDWGNGLGGAYQFSATEHDVVLDMLRDLRRRFQVDNDRVFLFGFEEGGKMAYDVGLSHPDLFAGVMPMTALPRWQAVHYWPNAQYLPFYVIDGDRDGANVRYNRDQFKSWVRRHFPSLYIEYKGRGKDWFAAELPFLFDWMSYKKRAHPLRSIGGKEGFRTMREGDNRFYWLSTHSIRPAFLNEAGSSWRTIRHPAGFGASITSSNTIYATTLGVNQLTVWFAPAMVNFERPVTVKINGQVKWKKLVKPSLETMLEGLYERGDRHALYLAKLDFNFK
jgi:predicted esterase